MKYGLLGYPLGHSMSPVIHKALLRSLEINAEYDLYPTPPEKLTERVPALLSMDGFNVTIPYKTEIIKFLDGVEGYAERYGSVNTVAMKAGRNIGYNTDCIGFLRALTAEGIPFEGNILLLGAGGAGRVIAYLAAEQGLPLTIAARDTAKAKLLADEIESKIGKSPIEITGFDTTGEFDLIINSTPVGVFPKINECPVFDEQIKRCKYAYDLVYNPKETLFMKKAKDFGLKTAGGLSMLVFQAVASEEIWHNCKISDETANNIIENLVI
ncbi:MAG: shikimate dehydrogenase [Ruminococcus sp.]|jgi:shikimate dehydrogenase|nr:shikimate dehydrogenase [Ruminococcus sp.]